MGITVQTRNDGAQLKRRRALVAGSVGNFIEWYEFGVYGFFATIIASNFFKRRRFRRPRKPDQDLRVVCAGLLLPVQWGPRVRSTR